MREIIQEGRDINEAIETACQKLGVEREAAEFEIISLPKRGFLGFKNTPAKVRVYINEPEPELKREAAPQPRVIREKPIAAPLQQKENPVVSAQKLPAAPEAKHLPVKNENGPERRPEPTRELTFLPVEALEGKAKTAVNYLHSVLSEIGVTAMITAAQTESGIVLRLSGEGLGVIIGRRGETLDALQYLCGLVANREEGDYLRVTIDSGNYREKRERTLQQLARKISSTAVRYGRSSTLEPMNPYERRIIHAAVSEIEGVTSSSIGEEPNRRVVISPTNPRPQSGGRGPQGGRGPRPAGVAPRPPHRDSPPREGGFRDASQRDGGRSFDRPRRDDRGPRSPRPVQGGGNVKPTSTQLDRTYAEELTRNPELGRPQQQSAPAPAVTAPVREKSHDEGKELPLYGKIEL